MSTERPVVLTHLYLDAERNITACQADPIRPTSDTDWPDVPRKLCPGCRLAGHVGATPPADRERALVAAIRNERRRWYDLREYAVKAGDSALSAAMDAATERYAERSRTGESPSLAVDLGTEV